MSESSQPAAGDHLRSRRGLYDHHGIYVGDNRVVHYSGLARGLQSGPVVLSELDDFLGGHPFEIVRETAPAFPPEEICARALGRVGENLYHPLFNNCEHFVQWCINGRHRSPQVNAYAALSAGLPGYLLARGGSGLAALLGKAHRWYRNRKQRHSGR